MVKPPTIRNLWPLGAVGACMALAVFYYGGDSQYLLHLVSLILVVMTAWRGWFVLAGSGFSWSPVHTGLAIYAALLVVNVFTSTFPENTVNGVWLLLVMPMLVFLLGDLRDERWHRLVAFLGVPMCLSVLWGMSEFIAGQGRASGPVIDPNSWAAGLNIFFFIIAAIFLTGHFRTAVFLMLPLILIPAAVFMSGSRVGLLILLAGVAAIVLLTVADTHYRRKSAALVVAVVLAFGLVQTVKPTEQQLVNEEGYTVNPESLGWTLRLAQWKSALEIYKDYPVAGSGFSTFKVHYPKYRSLEDQRTAGNYVHNDYLQFLVEGGPLILVMVLCFVGLMTYLFFRSAINFWKHRKEQDLESLVLVIAIGTSLVHGLMNFTLMILVNQILIACVLARLLRRVQLIKRDQHVSVQWQQTRWVAPLALVYVLTVNTLDIVSFDLTYKGGLMPVDWRQPDAQQKVFETISAIEPIRPNVSTNKFSMATMYRTIFDAQPLEAVDARRSLAIVTALEYQRGLELNPWQRQIRVFFADFLLANPFLSGLDEIYQTPLGLLEGDVALFPCELKSYLPLSSYLIQTGQADEAYDMLVEQALPWVSLRYDGHNQYRLEFFGRLLPMAIARDDKKVLKQLLNAVEESIQNP